MRLIGNGTLKQVFIPDHWFVTAISTAVLHSNFSPQLSGNPSKEYVGSCLPNNGGHITLGQNPLIASAPTDGYSINASSSAKAGQYHYFCMKSGLEYEALRHSVNHVPKEEVKLKVGIMASYPYHPSNPSATKTERDQAYEYVSTGRTKIVSDLYLAGIEQRLDKYSQRITTVGSSGELSTILGITLDSSAAGRIVCLGITEHAERYCSDSLKSITPSVSNTDTKEGSVDRGNGITDKIPYFVGDFTMGSAKPVTVSLPVWIYYAEGTYYVSAYEIRTNDKTNQLYLDDISVEEIVDGKNKELVRVAKARRKGADVKVDRTKPILPDDVSPEVKTNFDNWWEEFLSIADDVDGIPLGGGTEVSSWLSSNPGKTIDDYKGSINADEKKGTTSWNSFWSSLSKGTSKVWDTITQWGPLQIAGAYAGVKATNAVSRVSPWAVVILVGVGALVLLK